MIAGNRRIRSETIQANIRTRPGTPFDEATLKSDVARLWSLGYFDDITVTDQAGRDGGRTIRFNLLEKPPQKNDAVH